MIEPLIETEYRPMPIPDRDRDWSAWEKDNCDEDSIVGYGKTEAEAINNLLRGFIEAEIEKLIVV